MFCEKPKVLTVIQKSSEEISEGCILVASLIELLLFLCSYFFGGKILYRFTESAEC